MPRQAGACLSCQTLGAAKPNHLSLNQWKLLHVTSFSTAQSFCCSGFLWERPTGRPSIAKLPITSFTLGELHMQAFQLERWSCLQ